jgi:iron complex transport system substrate-binding protein
VADGNGYFNRPGPRLVDTLELIAHCLYPEHQPLPDQLRSAVIRLDPNGLALQETSS